MLSKLLDSGSVSQLFRLTRCKAYFEILHELKEIDGL